MSTFISKSEASDLLQKLSEEFALVKNPDYIHPAYEFYPLAPKRTTPVDSLTAAVMDMDGTTTTTEELCLHSLEFMIRKMSGRMSTESWKGLDHTIDYPYIIGNSTTKHVEYLIRTYQTSFIKENVKKAFLYAALWTLKAGKDQKRREEVTLNLINLHVGALLEDNQIGRFLLADGTLPKESDALLSYLMETYGKKFHSFRTTDLVKMGIDIYYQRYHEILERIRAGESRNVTIEIFHDPGKHLIHPMPGVLIFLALIKGWLGDEAGNLTDELLHAYELKSGSRDLKIDREALRIRLLHLSRRFEKIPVKIAIVTSSIFYEADIVMTEVCSVLQSEIDMLPLSDGRKEFLHRKMSRYQDIYSAFVTASDANEIRLKPHRDLYSIALHQLNVHKEDFDKVVGFEDSESGTIAIRAAGIGLCVAVPFAQTSGHNLDAAAYICKGGLPETIIEHNIFLKSEM